ncbi:hypothetical protein THRCLA_03007 [Thraustotheca clavata]|uniref:SAC3/GANP/THP3 conserved domain-containing protein n=1 Tax=Thraustotheca clavata TaxID=74557 RepID=A0A1W0A3K9_9STRA|nr:hypothetical protein THRCLA_03007 [Thraustotheca clavata]
MAAFGTAFGRLSTETNGFASVPGSSFASNMATNGSTTVFGGGSTTFSSTTFGKPRSTGSFEAQIAPNTTSFGNAFNAKPTTTFGDTTTTFGAATTFGNTNIGTTTFGSSNTPGFGSTMPSGSNTTSFGRGNSSTTTMFGTPVGGNTTFGAAVPKSSNTTSFSAATGPSATSFGGAPAGGSNTTTFGMNPTSNFGRTSFGGATTTTTFGQSSGNPSTSSPAFNSSTPFGAKATGEVASPSTKPSIVFGGAKPTPSNTVFGVHKESFKGSNPQAKGAFERAFKPRNTSFSLASPDEELPFGKPSKPEVKTKKRLTLSDASPLPCTSPSPSPPSRKFPKRPSSPVKSEAISPEEIDLEKTDLSQAVTLDGTCIDMCSQSEREKRLQFDDLSAFEKGEPAADLIVKKFQRAAADHKLNIPDQVRPPGVLRWTLLYLEQNIMDREELGIDDRIVPPRVPDLLDIYNFMWNRTRMIRQDFVLQNYRGGGRNHPIAMDVHERIARYYILSQHELIDEANFVEQQNIEQLGKTLRSLHEYYEDARSSGDPLMYSPFEAEFAGYFILGTLDNGGGLDVLKFFKQMPKDLVGNHFVQFAWSVFVARRTNDYASFFRLLREATYLQACLMHRYFPNVRSNALESMNMGYKTQGYPLSTLTELLCFEDEDHAASVCEQHGLSIDERQEVRFGTDSFETDVELRQAENQLSNPRSQRFITVKRGDYYRRDVCRGVTEYEEYPSLSPLVQETENEERKNLYPARPPYDDPYTSFESKEKTFKPQVVKKIITPPTPQKPSIPEPNTEILVDIERRQQQILEERQKLLQKIKELEQKKTPSLVSSAPPAPSTTNKLPSFTLNPPLEPTITKEPDNQAAFALQAKEEAEKEARRIEEELRAKEAAEKEAARIATLKAQKEQEAKARAAEQARLLEEARIKKEREDALREQQRKAEEARLALELQRKREKEEAEARERLRLAKIAELKAFGQKWLRINFDMQVELEKRWAREAAIKAARRKARQHHAIKKLRFALWRRFVQTQREEKSLQPPIGVEMLPAHLQTSAKQVSQWLFKGFSRLPRCLPAWSPSDEKRSSLLRETRALLCQSHVSKSVDLSALIGTGLAARYPGVTRVQYRIGIIDTTCDSAWLKWWQQLLDQSKYHYRNASIHVGPLSPRDDCLIAPVSSNDLTSLISQAKTCLKKLANLRKKMDLYIVCNTTLDEEIVSKISQALKPPPCIRRIACVGMTWSKDPLTALKMITSLMSPNAALHSVSHVDLHSVLEDVLEIALYESHCRVLTNPQVIEASVREAFVTLQGLILSANAAESIFAACLRPHFSLNLQGVASWSSANAAMLSAITKWMHSAGYSESLYAPVVQSFMVREDGEFSRDKLLHRTPWWSLFSFLYSSLLDSALSNTSITIALPTAWLESCQTTLKGIFIDRALPPISTLPKRKVEQAFPQEQKEITSTKPKNIPISAVQLTKKWSLESSVKRVKASLELEQRVSSSYRAFLEQELHNVAL